MSTSANSEVENSDRKKVFYKKKCASLFKQLSELQSSPQFKELELLDEVQIKFYLDEVHQFGEDFNHYQTCLEEADYDELETSARQEFTFLAISIKTTLMKVLNSRKGDSHHSTRIRPPLDETQQGSFFQTHSKHRLPLLQIPKFSGIYTEWPDFYSMFKTIVHEDMELSNVEKFQHLRSSLSGSALDTVRSLQINDANYDVALEMLTKRFDNKRLNFQSHVREIFSISALDSPSAVALRSLSDKISSHIRSLSVMGNKQQLADAMIIHVVSSKLDKASRMKWEEQIQSSEIPTWSAMEAYLERRCQMLENVAESQNSAKQVSSKHINNSKKSFLTTHLPSNCVRCSGRDHQIYRCQDFLSMTPVERFKEAKRLQLCINCLKGGHKSSTCNSGSCSQCKSKHNTLLHMGFNAERRVETQPSLPSSSHAPIDSQQPSTSLAAISNKSSSSSNEVIILATAVVFLKNSSGSYIPCRALLDSASQINFITTRLAAQLQLSKILTATHVSGIAQSSFVSNHAVNILFKSRTQEHSSSMVAVVTPTITEYQPQQTLNSIKSIVPSNIVLADPLFFESQRIDLLIGASHFFDIMSVGQIRLGNNLPILQKTLLGWIVSGGSKCHIGDSSNIVSVQKSTSEYEPTEPLDDLLKSFWEVESEFDKKSKFTKEELDCENHFVKTYSRLESGEFLVSLPAKDLHRLGDSYNSAFHRLKLLEKRLSKHIETKSNYCSFMDEYLDLQHMSLVTAIPPNTPTYFLPHHCVHKSDSTTTKLRVVFDGSAITTSGVSLNQVLMAGPTIQPKLFSILIRFRTFPIALTADIAKMYRCVRVNDRDSYLQCILWRKDPAEPIQIFKLDTVTYGTKPASFLAIRAMHELANISNKQFPLGSNIIKRDFYVDDLISGANSEEEALKILQETTDLLHSGNFVLRKWCSNNENILSNIKGSEREKFLTFDDGTNITKTLRLIWEPSADTFLFSLKSFVTQSKITKRSVLSTIARFYDPLGLIGPVLTKAKIIMQMLWKENIHWDESLPQHLHTSWLDFCNGFKQIERLVFPRYLLTFATTIQLHAFCDASTLAYGCAVYIRSKSEGVVSCRLLCSKSRVAPIKQLTIPKLELSAALLLSDLVSSIVKMNIFNCEIFCWSDSSIVLSWLRSEASRFNVFVSNRISKIQIRSSNMKWGYVPTSANPADIISRGATPAELLVSNLWTSGPEFLQLEPKDWPRLPNPSDELPEKRKNKLSLVSIVSSNFKYINSFTKMQRIFGYICRFYLLIKSGIKQSGLPTVAEVHQGSLMLAKIIQKSTLKEEYAQLAAKIPVSSKSKIYSLNPFLDQFGVIRVGGRLENSLLHFESKHPVILPKRHPYTEALIHNFHLTNLHAGPQALLASIRLQYWPIGGLKEVRRIVNKCITCFRVKPTVVKHIMGNLPTGRVQGFREFLVTGVDFCGPFFHKSEIRTRAPIKCYISVFICFATKAVHLELVKDLTTESFLAALKRFICTRGKPKTIWSDNATNFVGAKNELAELKKLFESQIHKDSIHQQCLQDGIEWRFIPPRSPHFGGLWESAVKIAKYHFYRVVRNTVLNFEDLRTLVCQISAIVNSRPLIPLTEHSEDLDVLTPAHFLIGAPFSSIVEPDITMLNVHKLSRWQTISFMQQIFWKKWNSEYLTQLQQRSKWRIGTKNLQVGDMVVIKDEGLPPMKWPLARVIETILGTDGVARVAILKTLTGTAKRAVAKLCVLPIDNVESQKLPTGAGCFEKE